MRRPRGTAVGAHAATGDVLGAHIARVGAAALDDEAGDVAVELEPVIEAGTGELAEVGDVDGGARTVKAHAHDALAGVEDGNLVAEDLVLGSVEGILVEAEGHGLLLASVVRGSTPLV